MSAINLTLSFWKPAIDKDNFEYKEGVLISRAAIAYIASNAFIALRYSFAPPAWLTLPPLFCVTALTLCDAYRSKQTLNRIALEALQGNERDKAFKSLETNSLATEAYIKEFKQNPDRFAPDCHPNILLKNIILRLADPNENLLWSFELLVDNGYLQPEDLIKLLELDLPEVKKAIEKSNPNAFSAEQQCALWSKINRHNKECAKLLIKKFDINAVNQSGETALEIAIRENVLERVCLLLKYGAKAPKGEVADPLICAALKQRRLKSNLEDTRPSFFSTKPLVHVYQSGNYMGIDAQIFVGRVMIASGAALGVFVAACLTAKLTPLIFSAAIILATYKYASIEIKRVSQIVERLAIREFDTQFPSTAAANYLLLKSDLLQFVNYEKLTETGATLWSKICHPKNKNSFPFSSFKMMADRLFEGNRPKFAFFLDAVKSERIDFVEYLLKEKVSASDFSLEQIELLKSSSKQNEAMNKLIGELSRT